MGQHEGRALTNGDALELILDALPVRPNAAQIAIGRTLAYLCDGDPNAAMMAEYRAWLHTVESAIPDEPDELDKAQ